MVSIIPGIETARRMHGDEKRVLGVAELPAGRLLHARERFFDVGLQPFEVARADVVKTDRCVDREARRHRNPERGHVRQAGALTAQALLTEARALGTSLTEIENSLHFSTTISEKSAIFVNSRWMAESSA